MNLKEQYKRIGGKQIKEQVEVGKVYDDVSHPPFANEADWKAQWDKKLNEAPMDKGFQKEWERNCKVLLTHLEHEAKSAKGADKSTVKKMIQTMRTVKGYPELMGRMFGAE